MQLSQITAETLLPYWWGLIPIFITLFFKPFLRVLLGMVIVPEDMIGLVTKKFVLFGSKRSLPDGRILATQGEAGIQARALAPGLYWMMWPWNGSPSL